MPGSFCLSIKDLHQLTGTLRDVYFDKTKWFDLGLSLHLLETELRAIKDKCSSDSHNCLRECLCLWLKSAESPQAQVLANALDDISKKAAERIRKIFCNPSSQYLMSCSDELRDVVFDDSIVSLMCTEGLIDGKLREEIKGKGNILFDGAIRAICLKLNEDPSKLKVLADILLKSETTESVGRRLLSNFNQNLDKTQELSNKNAEREKIFVNEVHEEMFETMRGDFGNFKIEISLTIAKAKLPMKGQKEFLKCCFPELKSELSSAKTTKKIVNTLLEKCTIINVAKIKTYVEKYKIKSGIDLVEGYKKKVEEFCSNAKVGLALNKNLSPGTSSLRCEEIEIVLDWEPSEQSLKDIKLLLKKVFSYLYKRVIIKTITEGSSIIITCYAPQYLMDELLLLAQANLPALKEEEKLIRLCFGHHTVFDKTTREKETKRLDKKRKKSHDSRKITAKIGPAKERESKHGHTEASREIKQKKLIDESMKVMLHRISRDEIIKRKKDAMIQRSKPFLRERKKIQKGIDKNNGETTKTVTPILVPKNQKSNAETTKRWTSPIIYTSPPILVPETRRRTCKSNVETTKNWISPSRYTSPPISVH